MAELVIVTKNPDLEIGKVYRGLTTGPHNEPEPNQCYRVVAHSTITLIWLWFIMWTSS